jgi:hypothetical protein
VFISQHKLAVVVVVHPVDDFRPVDAPDVSQFRSVEFSIHYIQAVLTNVLGRERSSSLEPLAGGCKLQQVAMNG